MLDNMIFDRTEADVEARNAKGTYNASDLNRVCAAINSVTARLYADGYGEPVTLRTDFAPTGDVRIGELSPIVESVKMIRGCLGGFEDTPNAPDSIRFLDYNGANAIEKILYDADLLLDRLEDARVFAGEMYSGEDFVAAPSVKDFDGSVAEFGGGIAGVEIAPFMTRISHNGMTAANIAVTRKNMLLRPYIHDSAYTNRGITFTPQSDGTVTASGTLSGTNQPYNVLRRIWLQPGVIYSISHGCNHARAFCVGYFRDYANTQNITPDGWDVDLDRAISSNSVSALISGVFHQKRTFYVNEPCVLDFQIRFSPTSTSQTVTDAVFKPMLYIGGEGADWDIAPTWEQATGEIITIPFGTTVDEGVLNVTTGELTVVQPTAATYQLTPTEVTMLEGYNQIVSDTGAVAFNLGGIIE